MDYDTARSWIISASLVISGGIFMFFPVSPALGYPLTFDQAVRLLEIVMPVFLGYLGSATRFIFHISRRSRRVQLTESSPLLGLIVRGPLIVFGFACVAVIAAFGVSNRSGAVPGSGMSIDTLALVLSAALGLLAATTGVQVSYLFATSERNNEDRN